MSVELRDGSRIVIRPIEPDDRAALVAGFERLSPESRYRRFFGPVARLSEHQLDYFTDVDHHDHEALVAVAQDSGEGVGVARYVRIGPDVAEPTIVIADDWQGRGAGTQLLDALAGRAYAEGIRRFEAPVLAYNQGAIALFERLGSAGHEARGREVELTIDLPEPGTEGHAAALLKQFAIGAAEPARTLLDLLWPRPRLESAGPERNVIVVGTDGSAHAALAVAAASELALATHALVEVVGAHPFLLAGPADVSAAVREAAAGMRERGLHVHEHVRRGDPALLLAEIAAEQCARLIVVGAGEHSDLARRLLGGTAELVAERAPCSVLIVRPSP